MVRRAIKARKGRGMRSNVSFRRGSMTFRTFYTRLSSEGKEGDFLMKDLGGGRSVTAVEGLEALGTHQFWVG